MTRYRDFLKTTVKQAAACSVSVIRYFFIYCLAQALSGFVLASCISLWGLVGTSDLFHSQLAIFVKIAVELIVRYFSTVMRDLSNI